MRRRNSGQAILLFVLLLGVAMGMLGLAIDAARVFEQKRNVQAMADAAALGAAFELRNGRGPAAMEAAAWADVRINGFRDDSDRLTVTPIVVSAEQGGVHVSISRQVRTTLMAMFGARELSVSGVAEATLARGTAPCLLALAPEGAGTLVIEGDGALRVECDVEVRSSDPEALMLTGSSCLSADGLRANVTGDACVSPRPSASRGSAEPATGPPPVCTGLPAGAATARPDGTLDYWPGCYAERIVIEEGAAEFAPGRYVLLDGLEIVRGEVRGDGVSFAIAAGPLEILDGATVDLHAAKREILFDTADTVGGAQLTPGPGSRLSGALQLTRRDLIWRPNRSDRSGWNAVTANSLRLIVEDDARLIRGPSNQSLLSEARPVLIR